MMNVAFVGDFHGGDAVNGVFFAAQTLAQGLKELGVKVFFYGVSNKAKHFLKEECVYRHFRKGKFPMFLSSNFTSFLRKNPDNIDVFHFHSVFVPFFVPVQRILISKKLPYVITPHGGYEQSVLKKNKLLKKLYLLLFEKKLIRSADRVICVSEHEVQDIERIAKDSHTEVIYNPVSIDEENIMHQNVVSAKQVLIYLGRYDIYHKGLDILLQMFKEVEAMRENVELHLYGSGKDKEKLRQMIYSLGLKKAFLNDPVYGVDKVQVLKNATAYIQVSNWETFGISIVEAMMLRKSIILSSGCALSKYLLEARAGLVINNTEIKTAAENIVDYLSGGKKLELDGEKLRALAMSKFSLGKIAEETFCLYQQFIKKSALHTSGQALVKSF